MGDSADTSGVHISGAGGPEEVRYAQSAPAPANMRPRTTLLLLTFTLVACLLQCVRGQCRYADMKSGCKIDELGCVCGRGCDYPYLTKRVCLNVLRERNSNYCYLTPCVRGTCIQTAQDPGFTCKCEGTGFYGQRCEKACPTVPMRGRVFPHECIVI